jgi:hypothetical protein
VRRIIWEYGVLVVALATSIGSFIWGLNEALPQTPKSAIGWFIVAYVSEIVAALIFFDRQRLRVQQVEERLAVRGVTEARLGEAGAQLVRLSVQEIETLRLLLTAYRLTGPQAHAWLSGEPNLNRINQATTFLELDEQTGCWSIHQGWRDVLGQLLCPAPTTAGPGSQRVTEMFVRWAAIVTALVLEIIENSRRITRQRQTGCERRRRRPENR